MILLRSAAELPPHNCSTNHFISAIAWLVRQADPMMAQLSDVELSWRDNQAYIIKRAPWLQPHISRMSHCFMGPPASIPARGEGLALFPLVANDLDHVVIAATVAFRDGQIFDPCLNRLYELTEYLLLTESRPVYVAEKVLQ